MPSRSSKTLNIIMERRVHLCRRIMKKPYYANYLPVFLYIILTLDLIWFLLSILLEAFTNIVIGLYFGHCLKDDCFVLLIVLFFYVNGWFCLCLLKNGKCCCKKQ